MTDQRQRFRDLHDHGCFLLPNPWDVGSARALEAAGAVALATTSSGLAQSIGKVDGEVTLDELVAHTAAITAAVGIPLNVDAERCYDDPAATVDALAAAGAAGLSIEDWDGKRLYTPEEAAARVWIASEAAHRNGVVLTARSENHLHGVDDADDTLARLAAYRDAGADVLYAPLIPTLDDLRRVVALGLPVNALTVPGAPSPTELAAAGARRISTGGALARAAYAHAVERAEALRPG